MNPINDSNPIQRFLHDLGVEHYTHKVLTQRIKEIADFILTSPNDSQTNTLLSQIAKRLQDTGYNREAREIEKLKVLSPPTVDLPIEIWKEIFSFVEPKTVMQKDPISKKLYEIKKMQLINYLNEGRLGVKDFKNNFVFLKQLIETHGIKLYRLNLSGLTEDEGSFTVNEKENFSNNDSISLDFKLLSNLNYVDLSNSIVSSKTLVKIIDSIPKLTTLVLKGFQIDSLERFLIEANLKNIKGLNLSNTNFMSTSLTILLQKDIPNLTELYLDYNSNFNFACLEECLHANNFTKLEILSCSHSSLKKTLFIQSSMLPSTLTRLRILNVSFSKIDSITARILVQGVKELPALTLVDLKYNPIERLKEFEKESFIDLYPP